MLTIIGFISIFAAITVFFSDELTAYVRALKAKPLLFLALSLLLVSSVTVLCDHCFVWVIVTVWVELLMTIGWVINELRLPNGIIALGLAKWLIFIVVSLTPLCGVWLLIQWKKPFKKIALVWRRQSYEVSVILGVILLLLMGLQLPGVNSY